VKASDSVSETARPQTQVKALYASVVAQLVIRTLHELFQADSGGHVDTIVINGIVDTVDPGSGRPIQPCLVTVRTTRELFDEMDLAQVEPLACLRHVSAGVSKSPAELLPVRPVLEFNMVDPRFVAEGDALSELDKRPNLMDPSFTNSSRSSRTCSPRWAWKQGRPGRRAAAVSIVSPRTRGPSAAGKSSSKPSGIRTWSVYPPCGTFSAPSRTKEAPAKEYS
jgi:hypothetical protein